MADYLLFASERYALPILQPLADALQARGHHAHAWLLDGAHGARLAPSVGVVDSPRAAVALRPRAVFSAANWVPPFVAGAKVQVFHGFNARKRESARGHFRVRGLFDLYCTHGPSTTAPFAAMARAQGHFKVVETGWPKLDPLFRGSDPLAERFRAGAAGRPVVLFASTFTERLSAAPHLFDAIHAEVNTGTRHWLLTLHPKCEPAIVERYRALAGAHATFVEPEQLVSAERAADALVADTTSVVPEFVVQHKPVVTFRHREPSPCLLDFDDPSRLGELLHRALSPTPALMEALRVEARDLHPSRDGHASERVIDATDALLAGELGPLRTPPLGARVRALQIRQRLGYWGRGLR